MGRAYGAMNAGRRSSVDMRRYHRFVAPQFKALPSGRNSKFCGSRRNFEKLFRARDTMPFLRAPKGPLLPLNSARHPTLSATCYFPQTLAIDPKFTAPETTIARPSAPARLLPLPVVHPNRGHS